MMISFACRKLKKEDLVRCSFGMTKTEYTVLSFMLKSSCVCTAIDIAKKLSLERTTVQKSIKGLLAKKLVKRKKKNLSHGGFIFIYETENPKIIKSMIKKNAREWYKGVENMIDKM